LPRSAESEFALIRDHLEDALEAPTDPARWGSAATDADLYVSLADAAAEIADLPTLERYAPLALAAARRLDHRLYAAVAERADGIRLRALGHFADSLEPLSRAFVAFDRLGTRWQTGQTLMARAATYAALGQDPLARGDRLQALDLFTALGARPAAEAAARLLRE